MTARSRKSTVPFTGIPELLAPAGTLDKMAVAIHYGADAVYLGDSRFSLRARAGNFDREAITRAVRMAHDRGVRVYVTVNIFAHNRDLEEIEPYLLFLDGAGVDGLIIADPGLFRIARTVVPEMDLHVSTQANITNWSAVRFWRDLGASRVNLARELSLEEIRTISKTTDLELEVFVHGALCISYSGRCLLSRYLTGRDANHGDCAHPCRYAYRLEEEKRPGQYFPVEEDHRGTYIFNSRDLCLIRRLPELVAAGVNSIKIEGRMKSVGYVAQVVRAYRGALDWIDRKISSGHEPGQLVLPNDFIREMERIGTRGQTENFFDGHPSTEAMLYDTMKLSSGTVPAALVRRVDPLVVDVRSGLIPGDRLEYLGPGLETRECRVTALCTEKGDPLEKAHPGTRVCLETEPVIADMCPYSLLRKNPKYP